MTIENLEIAVSPILEKYDLSCERQGEKLVLRDKKKVVIGSVSTNGDVERKQQGAKQLMGALVRDDLKSLFA